MTLIIIINKLIKLCKKRVYLNYVNYQIGIPNIFEKIKTKIYYSRYYIC